MLELQNVYYSYTRAASNAALENINLKIDGGITGVIGPTGSGKSTLAQLLNGIFKPLSGKVLLDGEDIWANPKKIRDVRFKVGLVMQYPEYQLFDETVRSDIAFGPKNMGLSADEINNRVKKAAEFTGLSDDALDKSPFELSGGQKRRAALAGVLAMEPRVLVLDEPAAGLDPAGRREILGNVKKYQRESGSDVIIVSHSMEDMAMYCDRIIVLCSGKIIMHDTTAAVFSRYTELLSIGLDVPQITRVASALREYGIDIGNDVYTVDFAAKRLIEYLKNRGEAPDEL